MSILSHGASPHCPRRFLPAATACAGTGSRPIVHRCVEGNAPADTA